MFANVIYLLKSFPERYTLGEVLATIFLTIKVMNIKK